MLSALATGAALLAAPSAHAQTPAVPNGSLDTWVTRNGAEEPQGWQTFDDLYLFVIKQFPITGGTHTTAKTATAHSGAYAAQLQSIQFSTNTGPVVLPGYLFLGNAIVDQNLTGGIPYTARPSSLQFYYKLAGTGAIADSAAAQVILTATVGGQPVVVGFGGGYFTATATNFTLANLPISYDPTTSVAPDTVRIIFASGVADNLTAGTTLVVDDVVLVNNTVTATRASADLSAGLGAYPNPSAGGAYTLSYPSEPALLAAPLAVVDATGRVVRRESALRAPAATRALDLRGLAGGLYTLQLFTDKGLIAKKLLVQ